MKLVGDIALVTGAGQGIGRAIASSLVEHGANVVIFDVKPEGAERARAELSRLAPSRKVVAVVGSVTSAQDVQAAFDQAERELGGPVQMLVNNAGVAVLSPVADMTEEDWDTVIDVNLKGTFLCSREFSRRLIRAGKPGGAVNISSLNCTAATDGLGHYCAAKAGIAHFTKVCAAEWGRYGIRANAIAPGSIRTPLTVDSGLLGGDMGREFLSRTPLGRIGETEDIAHVSAFLLSEESYWITGATLPVDGGQHIRGLHSYWDTLNPVPEPQLSSRS
jgi:3-oxoacyl-[acyl-carrier protein] reductase